MDKNMVGHTPLWIYGFKVLWQIWQELMENNLVMIVYKNW